MPIGFGYLPTPYAQARYAADLMPDNYLETRNLRPSLRPEFGSGNRGAMVEYASNV